MSNEIASTKKTILIGQMPGEDEVLEVGISLSVKKNTPGPSGPRSYLVKGADISPSEVAAEIKELLAAVVEREFQSGGMLAKQHLRPD